jgi:small subunit ribosomal protein S1
MEEHHSSIEESSAESRAAMSMSDLLEQWDTVKEVKRGDTVKGTIVSVTPHEVLVDVGAKSEGVVAGRELERLSDEDLAKLKEGDEVAVYVLRPDDDEDGHIWLSVSRAWIEKDWLAAQELYDSGECYTGTVANHNKGGLIVHFGQVRGFVPVSQLESSRGITRSGTEEQWSQLVGEELRVKIIEIDRERNRLILSERAAMQEWRKGQKERLLGTLKPGDVVTGRVASLADFGAFVDLGGADGLIHLSEISWASVSHPRDVMQVGESVEVYVLQVDTERQRISLSLRRLQPEPWSRVLEKYEIGQLINATITRLATFGAFARVDEDEIEGLIHVSELTDANVTHPREVVNEGDSVSVRIIHINPERRRMGLSLKQAEGMVEWEAYQESDESEESVEESRPVAETVEQPESTDLEQSLEESRPVAEVVEEPELMESEQSLEESRPVAETVEQPGGMESDALSDGGNETSSPVDTESGQDSGES